MANKTAKKKVQAEPAINKIASPVVDSAREIWFAGLGVFSVAQKESGKLIDQGNKFFDKLVSEGTKLEKKTRKTAETTVDDIKGEVESQFDVARQQLVDSWDGLGFGNIFDERVVGTLDRLGIPTSKDLNRLSGRMQRMSSKTLKNWKELESAFEDRVSAVLKNMHIPTADDVKKLAESMKKISDDTTANLGKLEKDIGTQVSSAISDFEAATAKEFKTLNTGMKDVTGKVAENWDKLESVVEGRVNETLGGLGVPTADDINKLSSELRKLSRQVTAMEKKLKASAKPTVRKTTTKKAAAKKTAKTS